MVIINYDNLWSKLKTQAGLPQQCHQIMQQGRSWKVGFLGARRVSSGPGSFQPHLAPGSGRPGACVGSEVPSEAGSWGGGEGVDGPRNTVGRR